MSDGALMSLTVFWQRNGLSKSQFYYLKKIGRAPNVISIGTKDLISPEAEAAWRLEMTAKPIKGSLRKAAEKSEAASRMRPKKGNPASRDDAGRASDAISLATKRSEDIPSPLPFQLAYLARRGPSAARASAVAPLIFGSATANAGSTGRSRPTRC